MAVRVQFSKVKNIKNEVEAFNEKIEILNFINNSEDEISTLSDDEVENATPEEKAELIQELTTDIQNDLSVISSQCGVVKLCPEFDSRIILKAFDIECNSIITEISKTDLELFISKCRQVRRDNSLADELLPDGTEGLPDHNEYNHVEDILYSLRMALRAYKNIVWDTELMQLYCTWEENIIDDLSGDTIE